MDNKTEKINNKIEKMSEDLKKWFFWFWVKRFRVSFLIVFLIIISWIFSLFTIPKESSPDIKLWIISISTVYQWVNPTDIDSLITDKIEKEIKEIDWINKITSSSSVGISSIIIELDNWVDIRNTLSDIRDNVDRVDLPEDANDPSIVEISTSNELMFEVLLYWNADKFSQFDLINSSQIIKSNLEWSNWIASIDLSWANLKIGASSSASDYEIKVLLNKNKIEQLWLSLFEISSVIKSYNKNTPIWNYNIWNLSYDYRFDWEIFSIDELKNIVIRWKSGSNIILWDISKIVKEYPSEKTKKLWFAWESWYNFTSLVFNKAAWTNVFSVSKTAKESLENFIKVNPNFKDLNIKYKNDMTELIIQDYKNLSSTAVQTLVLVFITILIFVWFRESLIASMLLPLSFLVTFIVLDVFWLTLNFLTNFSLVLTLWIAIDTMIVIIEWASEKMHLWYNKTSAVLLAVRDYRSPLISGTMTTLVAFLPLIFLPGIMWKFLSYIPITVFSTLVAALILSLTISSALFVKFVKNSNFYHIDEKLEATFTSFQKEYLAREREWKQIKKIETTWIRTKVLSGLGIKYYNLLKTIISKKSYRLQIILYPIILLILTLVFISPNIWFILFPNTDEAIIMGTIEAQVGTDEKFLEKYLPIIDRAIYKYPELKVYYSEISWNVINVYIELLESTFRQKNWMKSVFEIEKFIVDDLKELESEWLLVSVWTIKSWPPWWKAIWIKLIANSSKKIEELKLVASNFKEYFKTIDWIKNISTTSSDSPGQFIFKFDRKKLAESGLIPDDILSEVYLYTNWIKAWSIKTQYEDNDIILKIKEFDENLSPDDINNLFINTKIWKIRLWDYANYEFTKAVSSINRENTKVSITVEADIEFWKLTSEIQPLLDKYALDFSYPDWITFKTWWENEENADLIISIVQSFFIAIFLIFWILVFQFNSYIQPIIVLYSVALALLWVNVWLYLTGNPYSITFMIWFIALTWVVVNDAIILIDRINKNLEKWIDNVHSVIAAWKSRLQPIMVTTLTTVFWVLPLALQDEFWAWLWFTIVFWLIAWSTMTLFVIPSLYYEVFLKNRQRKREL